MNDDVFDTITSRTVHRVIGVVWYEWLDSLKKSSLENRPLLERKLPIPTPSSLAALYWQQNHQVNSLFKKKEYFYVCMHNSNGTVGHTNVF